MRFALGILLLASGFLAGAPKNQTMLLVLLTVTAVYFGYRLQLGSRESA